MNEKNEKFDNSKNLMYNYLLEKENEYIINLRQEMGNSFVDNKIAKMNQILANIEKKKERHELSSKEYEEIRKIAISKGGFLKNFYRREFYKLVFKLNHEYIHLIHFTENNFKNRYISNIEFESGNFRESNLFPTEKKKKNEYIIEVDVKRTIANQLIKEEFLLEEMKEKLTKFLKKFILINKDYHYYQGFHDIAMYIYLIFYNYETLAVQMLHRISEYFLKDYLIEKDEKVHFRFETVFKITKHLIKKINYAIGDFLEKNTNIPDPIFCLPWIITLLTHDLPDIFNVLRIFDYILFSHPGVIYQMSSHVRKKYLFFRLLLMESRKFKNTKI
jgi:hypothetical protein